MLMSAHEFSRLFISVHDCSSAWFQKHSKCEFSKWAPCNDLQISKFIFHQIIKSDILKLYVERAVKNVQDEKSRPLGSQEIQKNKSGNRIAGHPVFW